MLIVVACFALLQFLLAVLSPRKLVYLTLITGAIPIIWKVQTQFATPIGTLNVVAIQAFGLCIAAMIVIAANFNQAMHYASRFKWHLIFVFVAALTIVYAPSAGYGLRMLAKLLGPLLIMFVVMIGIQTKDELQGIGRAVFVSGMFLCVLAYLTRALGMQAESAVYVGGAVGLGPPGMGPPVFAAHMLAVSMLALASFITQRTTSMLLVAALFALSLLAALQRTSAAAMLLGFSFILFLGTQGVTRFLLPAVSVVALPLILIFNEDFRRRMFFGVVSPEKILSDPIGVLSGIDSSGRFGLWGEMIDRFYTEHPFFGSGLGATQNYLYEFVGGGTGVVHSEYVRLLCEVGLVGLILFVVLAVSYVLRLSAQATTASDPDERRFALAGAGAMIGYLGYMATDNSFDYVNQFGAYVFAMIAMAFKARELRGTSVDAEVQREIPAVFVPNLMR